MATSISSIIRGLAVGQVVEFPAERARTVKATASLMGFSLDRKFSTRCSSERRVIEVIRRS